MEQLRRIVEALVLEEYRELMATGAGPSDGARLFRGLVAAVDENADKIAYRALILTGLAETACLKAEAKLQKGSALSSDS